MTKWARASRKHRIGHASALYVMANNEPVDCMTSRGLHGYRWTAPDDRGRVLDIIAVIVDAELLVIHCQPQYR